MAIGYHRAVCGQKSVDKNLESTGPSGTGGMYAAGVSRSAAEDLLKKYHCSNLTCVGCDNDPGLVTLSGSEKELKPIIVELQDRKILCRKVPTFGVAFHSGMLETGGILAELG